MLRTLSLLRHGLSAGQSPTAELLPEGAAALRRLATHLASEGWRPQAILTSPYRRARESAEVLTRALDVRDAHQVLAALVPEADPADALAAVLRAAPLAASILVVAHLPLLGLMATELIGDDPGFSPGTLVEIVREGDAPARLVRRVTSHNVPRA